MASCRLSLISGPAEFHELAAHAHRAASTEHGKGDHQAGHKHSKQAMEHSKMGLARTRLLLAHYGLPDRPEKVLPKISQETLAEMIGTTRSPVNFFMNKFRKMRFMEYNGEIRINNSLLSTVPGD